MQGMVTYLVNLGVKGGVPLFPSGGVMALCSLIMHSVLGQLSDNYKLLKMAVGAVPRAPSAHALA